MVAKIALPAPGRTGLWSVQREGNTKGRPHRRFSFFFHLNGMDSLCLFFFRRACRSGWGALPPLFCPLLCANGNPCEKCDPHTETTQGRKKCAADRAARAGAHQKKVAGTFDGKASPRRPLVVFIAQKKKDWLHKMGAVPLPPDPVWALATGTREERRRNKQRPGFLPLRALFSFIPF